MKRNQTAISAGDRRTGAGDGLPPVYLASRSPRRRLLLDEAGVRHTVIDSGVDDADLIPGGGPPSHWVAALAYLKAAGGARTLRERRSSEAEPGGIVLGADTVVVHRDRVIGQPRDAADAERIVRLLAEDEHDVLTGVALIEPRTGRRELLVDRASVRVGRIPDEEIAAYVAGGDWRGKAGAYNLSERLAAGWPIEFEGDPGTIMGLPMRKLPARLRAFAG